MPPNRLLRGVAPLVYKPTRPLKPSATRLQLRETAAVARPAHTGAGAGAARLAPSSGLRPRLPPARRPWNLLAGSRRTIFIQTESTPNPDALKFLPNHRVLPEGVTSPFIEYLSPRATISPPYPSPLASQLMSIDGVTSVFYGADFITVTKAPDANWAHIRPEVFSLITEAITSGQPIVNVSERGAAGKEGEAAGQDTQDMAERDSLSYDENDSEVVGMIKELLETRVRPAIQEDGGDIEFRGFENGYVLLKLRGACRTCDSSTVTLKNGIEGMLMHYVSKSFPFFPPRLNELG